MLPGATMCVESMKRMSAVAEGAEERLVHALEAPGAGRLAERGCPAWGRGGSRGGIRLDAGEPRSGWKCLLFLTAQASMAMYVECPQYMTGRSLLYTMPDLSSREGNASTAPPPPPPKPFPACIVKLRLELVMLVSFKARVAHDLLNNFLHFLHGHGQVLVAVPFTLMHIEDFFILSCIARAILLCKSSSISANWNLGRFGSTIMALSSSTVQLQRYCEYTMVRQYISNIPVVLSMPIQQHLCGYEEQCLLAIIERQHTCLHHGVDRKSLRVYSSWNGQL